MKAEEALEAERPHATAPIRMPWRAALRQAVTPRALRRTLTAAFVVGTTLFFVNLFGQVHDTRMTPLVAVRIALTYLVPWGNATFGIALGLRDRSG